MDMKQMKRKLEEMQKKCADLQSVVTRQSNEMAKSKKKGEHLLGSQQFRMLAVSYYTAFGNLPSCSINAPLLKKEK